MRPAIAAQELERKKALAAQAQAALRSAPPGTIHHRRKALVQAVAAVIAAELALRRAKHKRCER